MGDTQEVEVGGEVGRLPGGEKMGHLTNERFMSCAELMNHLGVLAEKEGTVRCG